MKVITHITLASKRGKDLTIVWGVHPFPTGKILIAITHEGICWTGLTDKPIKLKKFFPEAYFIQDESVTQKIATEMAKLWPHKMDDLKTPLVLYGTDFQTKVWKALIKVKAGKTATYGEIAKRIKRPDAIRAVGTACGANPVTLYVPCHRIVNKDSRKMNYGWGVKIKKSLLTTEGITV